jgi:hypothetical protein
MMVPGGRGGPAPGRGGPGPGRRGAEGAGGGGGGGGDDDCGGDDDARAATAFRRRWWTATGTQARLVLAVRWDACRVAMLAAARIFSMRETLYERD